MKVECIVKETVEINTGDLVLFTNRFNGVSFARFVDLEDREGFIATYDSYDRKNRLLDERLGHIELPLTIL